MKHEGKIDIYRTNNDGNMINFTIEDEKSGGKVISFSMKPEDLMVALTGLSGQDILFELGDNTNVGKKKLCKPLSFTICQDEVDFYGLSYNKPVLEKFIADNAYRWRDADWLLVPYLGSQNSIGYVKGIDGGILINTYQVKYE